MSKKPKPFDRRTFSLPPGLNGQLQKYPDVNWSGIVCRAIEQKLGEIAAQKEKKNMNDVIARLRASKQKAASEAYADGASKGKKWAENTATADELKRLELFCEERATDEWDNFFERNGAFSNAERIAFAIIGEGNRKKASGFWTDAIGDTRYSRLTSDDEFLRGFVDGAVEIWQEVESSL